MAHVFNDVFACWTVRHQNWSDTGPGLHSIARVDTGCHVAEVVFQLVLLPLAIVAQAHWLRLATDMGALVAGVVNSTSLAHPDRAGLDLLARALLRHELDLLALALLRLELELEQPVYTGCQS